MKKIICKFVLVFLTLFISVGVLASCTDNTVKDSCNIGDTACN